MASETTAPPTAPTSDEALDPIYTYTMSHFAHAIVADSDALRSVLAQHNAPNAQLWMIQECRCKLRASTFVKISENNLEMDICSIVFSGGLRGSLDENAQAEMLRDAGIDDPAFPHLGPGENIGGDCEGRIQFGDEDVSDFCEKHGITDEEWNEIQDKIKGKESTDAVYLER